MLKRIGLLMILLTLAMTLKAASPVLAQGSGEWLASYWNNTSLSGSPVLQRPENSVNYDWGEDSPHPDVNEDNFSARWVGSIYFDAALYRFTVTSDDGIRVWVDGTLIIDAWFDHPAQTFTADQRLSEGSHWVVVEYYEGGDEAVAQLWWQPISLVDGQSWRGEYYNNSSLSGNPVLVRADSRIDFNWGDNTPGPGVDNNDFSVRWTRTVDLPAGSYRFVMTVDDGGRLWVNSRLLIDAWQIQSPQTYIGDIYLPGGPIPIEMHYFDHSGGAVAQLSWEQNSVETGDWRGEYFNGTVPSGTPVFVQSEEEIDFNWGSSSPAPGLLGVDYFSARWSRTVNLPAGSYLFNMTVDDGARLWVDDRLLIDAWEVQSLQEYGAEIDWPGGPANLRVEYFENTGGAEVSLSWRRTNLTPPATPTPEWYTIVPPQWRYTVRQCLDYFAEIDREIGPRTEWLDLVVECREYLEQRDEDENSPSASPTVTPTPEWYSIIPSQWRPMMRQCENYFAEIGREIGPQTPWLDLVVECRQYLERQ